MAKNIRHDGQVRKDDDEEEGQSLHAKLLRYRYVRKIEARGVGEGVFALEHFLKFWRLWNRKTVGSIFFWGEGGHGELTSGAPGHLQNSYEWFGTVLLIQRICVDNWFVVIIKKLETLVGTTHQEQNSGLFS